jgi:hypothetical protein
MLDVLVDAGQECQVNPLHPDWEELEQKGSGIIHGKLLDRKGLPDGAAFVMAVESDSKDRAFHARTDEQGVFLIQVPPGRYSLVVTIREGELRLNNHGHTAQPVFVDVVDGLTCDVDLPHPLAGK